MLKASSPPRDGLSTGTDAPADRFPGRDGEQQALVHGGRCGRSGELRAGGDDIGRSARRNRRVGCPRWGRRGRSQRLLCLPRTERRGRRWVHPPPGGNRRRLSRAAAHRLRRGAQETPADELYRRQARPAPTSGGRPLLRGHAGPFVPRTGSRRSRSTPLPIRRSRARPALLCLVPRRTGGGHGAGQPAARGSVARLPRCPVRPLAAIDAAERSGERDASDQPAPDSFGRRGPRGLRCRSSRGSSQSGISGSIPRSTSWRSQKWCFRAAPACAGISTSSSKTSQ